MQVKKQQLEADMEQQTGSKLGKEYVKAIYYHPVYLTYMQSTSCEMPSWMKHKLESRLLGEISIISDMQITPPLWQKVKKNSRTSWWKWKEESEKAGLKLNIQKTKIMASGPVTSWQIEEEIGLLKKFFFMSKEVLLEGLASKEYRELMLKTLKLRIL